MARSFLAFVLAAGGKLGDRAARRGLRHLPAGVGVHLGVEQQHINVLAGAEHVIEAAEADVVGPAIAAEDPDALAHQRVGDREQIAGFGGVVRRQLLLAALFTRSRCALMPCFLGLVGVEDRVNQSVADSRRQARRPSPRA